MSSASIRNRASGARDTRGGNGAWRAVSAWGISAVWLVVLWGAPQLLLAAELTISPTSGEHPVGERFSVRIMLDAGGEPVNAAEGTVTFDTSVLEVSSISTDDSAFSLWTGPSDDGEPEYSNSEGTIFFSGGTPRGFSNARPVATISFSGKTPGSAEIAFEDDAVVTAADGQGTDVLEGTTGGTYTIAEAAPEPEPEPEPQRQTPAANASIPPPEPPEISSRTHAQSDTWYATSTAVFEWDIPYGITGVKVGFDQNAEGEPTEVHEPPIAQHTQTGIPDGESYFHLQLKNRGGFGETAHYRVLVDTTPPEPFELSAEGGDLEATLSFQSSDATSGLAQYVIEVDALTTLEIEPEEVEDGQYVATDLSPEEHTIVVRAIDEAGNTTQAETDVVVTGELPTDEEEDEAQGNGLFGPVYWVSMIFMAFLAIAVGMLIFERKRHAAEKERIQTEVVEAGDRLIGIFDVLREEIEEKVLDLSHKPNMTDTEREILEGLKDALDISEGLLDKEIEDVRKLLK